MKNLIKVSSYTLATALVFVQSQFSASAADGTGSNAITGGQVVGGLALLLAAILVPALKSARKAKT